MSTTTSQGKKNVNFTVNELFNFGHRSDRDSTRGMRGSSSSGEIRGRIAKRAGPAEQETMSRAQSETDLESWQKRKKIPSLREVVAQRGGKGEGMS